MTQKSVLVVDDDAFIHKFIARVLEPDYRMLSAYDGQNGLCMAEESHPDLIILDVNMPGTNGYETCEVLKSTPQTQDIPVLFLSAHGDTRHRLLGYEAGADDFLVKPFEPAELQAKLRVLIRYHQNTRQLQDSAQMATETALLAMTGGSDMGRIVQFVTATHAAHNAADLAKLFFATAAGFGLNASLLFAGLSEGFSATGRMSAMETEVMQSLHGNGQRIFDFGCRTQINYPRVAALIKNMPLDDPARYGRIKDLLPPMLEALDARIQTLNTEKVLIEQGADLANSLEDAEGLLADLASTLGANQRRIQQSMHLLMTDLEQRLPSMGLEEDQEQYLINRVDRAVADASELFDVGRHLQASFEAIIEMLERLTVRHQGILQSVLQSFEAQLPTGNGTTAVGGDVELF